MDFALALFCPSSFDPFPRSFTAGIIAGKFLERGRVTKFHGPDYDPIVYYLADDLYIGAKTNFNNHKFIIIDADEYALRYMEKHYEQVMRVRAMDPRLVVGIATFVNKKHIICSL